MDLRPCCRNAVLDGKALCGWCSACYQRWTRAGRPAEGPPAPMTREQARQLGLAACRANAAARRADYAELRSWGESREQAAARVGVSERTGERYEAARRSQPDALASLSELAQEGGLGR